MPPCHMYSNYMHINLLIIFGHLNLRKIPRNDVAAPLNGIDFNSFGGMLWDQMEIRLDILIRRRSCGPVLCLYLTVRIDIIFLKYVHL